MPVEPRTGGPGSGQINLWVTDLDHWADTRLDACTLTAREREHAERLRDPRAGRRLLARRSLMRAVLGHVLGTDDGALVISRQCPTCGSADHGRPFVADLPISYSVSSNGGVAAMATSVLSRSVAS